MSERALKRRRWLAVRGYETGIWAYLLHRLSGLFLVGYLFLHIAVISTAASKNGRVNFNQTLGFLQQPFFVVLDVLLIGVVLYHAANGIRVILFDMGFLIRRQRTVFWTFMAGAAVVWGYVLARLMPLVIGG